MPGTLYVVGTPIGNLEDVTLRALRVLREVGLIAAEDTRQTRKLLRHYDIRTPLLSYHSRNEAERVPELLARLRDGADLALVTDAGMPGISDPGRLLVDAALDAGLPVRVVPGPSAAVAAVALAGFPARTWIFAGFLPRTRGERERLLREVLATRFTVVLYESPHRVVSTLRELAALAPDRAVAVCRELTKHFEEVRRGPAAEVAAHFAAQPPKGEFTLVVAPPTPSDGTKPPGDTDPAGEDGGPGPHEWREWAARVGERIAAGQSPGEAMRQVAREYGVSRREVYRAVLRARQVQNGPWDTG